MKRIVDLVTSLIAIVCFAPILFVIFIAVKIFIGSPVVFVQVRPGKNSRLFKMYKFRTMTNERDAAGELLPDEQRLTSFGKFLRSTSLDELPEIFNIIRGDMSWVGPRPLLTDYLTIYSNEQARRHEVRPGLTGWAQVNGRNAISWEEKFKFDVWYVDNRSFILDAKIVAMTVIKIFKREGISSRNSATADRFRGSQ